MRPALVIGFCCACVLASGQPKEVTSGPQFWVGYMTSIQFSEKWSWWNDFHFVPTAFGVVRTGATRSFAKGSATAGFARLWLPTPGTEVLNRWEWRPWGQVQFVLPIDSRHSFTHRIRYDARFRQEVSFGQLVENAYTFNHRVRFLTSFRRNMPPTNQGWIPFVSLNNELLVNFGRTITYNTFDQNRVSVMGGLQMRRMQVQLGYMHRYVQTGERQFRAAHTLVVWITHRINARQLLQQHGHEMDGE